MNTFAINEARKPPRIGSLAMLSGALVGAVSMAGPAFSADLPSEDSYRQSYYYQNNSYDNGCYPCTPRPTVEERPVVERFPLAERHWVQRDFIERRYGAYSSGAEAAYPSYRYSYYYPGPGGEAYDTCRTDRCGQSYQAYEAAPRRYGFQYSPGYGGGYAPPYRYASQAYRPFYDRDRQPSYEYERSPRPPRSVPGSYYGPNYR
jgi:hypothetical protein